MAHITWTHWSAEATKRSDEALNALSPQFLMSGKIFIASLLRFFSSVERFIGISFFKQVIV
jgi:hypothetical protein